MKKGWYLLSIAAVFAAAAGCNESRTFQINSNKALCGNGVLDEGEFCDTYTSAECKDVDASKQWLEGGRPGCSAACYLTKGTCIEKNAEVKETCGNGILDDGEECDGNLFANPEQTCLTFLGAGATGSLSCNACHVSSSNCQKAVLCGNGEIDSDEVCDGSNFGDETCATLKGNDYEGSLKCEGCASINTAGCFNSAVPERVCEGNAAVGSYRCSAEGDLEICKDTGNFEVSKTCTGLMSVCDAEHGGCVCETDYCDPSTKKLSLCKDSGAAPKDCSSVITDENAIAFACNDAHTGCEIAACADGYAPDSSASRCEPVFCTVNGDKKIAAGSQFCVSDSKYAACSNAGSVENEQSCAKGKICNPDTINTLHDCEGVPQGCGADGDHSVSGEEECDVDADGKVIFAAGAAPKCGEFEQPKAVLVCNTDVCKINSAESCEEKPAVCGDKHLSSTEICDGALIKDGVAADCPEGKVSLETPVCLEDCSGIDIAASCFEPSACGTGTIGEVLFGFTDKFEMCDDSAKTPEGISYTPISCMYDTLMISQSADSMADVNKYRLCTAAEIAAGTTSACTQHLRIGSPNTCSAACDSIVNDCKAYTMDKVEVTPLAIGNSTGGKEYLLFAANQNDTNIKGCGVYTNVDQPVKVDDAGYAWRLGTWNASDDIHVPNLSKYVAFKMDTKVADLVEKYEYVSISFAYGRYNNTKTPKRMAIALYDDEDGSGENAPIFKSIVADFRPVAGSKATPHTTGEIVFSIKGLKHPEIHFVTYDGGVDYTVLIKDLRMNGINIKP